MIETFPDIIQGMPEWFDIRKGLATASRFSDILAKGEGKTRKKYLRQLAGELLTGFSMKSFENADTIRGHEVEPIARAEYAFLFDTPVARIGFVRNGKKGASPDGFPGDGIVEFKSADPHIQIEIIERSIADPSWFPPEHMAQTQGNLWVCEREWIDLFYPSNVGIPAFRKRIVRDPAYIATLARAVDEFNAELDELVAKIRSYATEA